MFVSSKVRCWLLNILPHFFQRVEHPASGRFLEMYSTEPGVQFYTAYYLNATGKGGASYKKFDAFCLEAQHYPDSPNKVSPRSFCFKYCHLD